MDALSNPRPTEPVVTPLRPGDGALPPDAFSCVPPEAPLAMPTQSLTRFDPAGCHRDSRHPSLGSWLARLFVFGGGFCLTLYGAHEMYKVIEVGGVTILEWALLLLFVANFSWIALACMSALAGFFWLLLFPQKPPAPPISLRQRTAIVMPIYNEAPSRIFAALEAMIEEVEASGLGQAFEWFFLSDTTDPEIFVAEEHAFLAMRSRLGEPCRLFYRHRLKNLNRKSGNIEEFVTRWGGRYPQMVVLDADSLMTGRTIIALAAAMEADPDAGHHSNTAADRQPQYVICPPSAIRGSHLWAGDRRGLCRLHGARWQLLGPQRDYSYQGFRRPLRFARAARAATFRRSHSQP